MNILVVVEGVGFEGTFDGTRERIGFFATRLVEARDQEHIDENALFKMLRLELTDLQIEATPCSHIQVEEVRAADDTSSDIRGFSFFVEDADSN